ARVEPENVLLVHVRRQVAGPVLGPHQRRHLGHDEAGQLVEVPVSLQVSGDAVEVGLEPVGVPLGLGGLAQVGHHQVDVVLEFFHLAAGVDLDVAGQVALGHGVGDLGDRTDLCGQIAGQTVHAVGELLPGARNPFDLGLTTQLALVADLVGHPGHLGGERRQLVHHRVDGRLDLENLALGVDVDLLGQVTGRDRGRDLGDVAHLRGEVVRHRVDVLGEVLPDAEYALDVGPATQLALCTHLTGHPSHFVGERRQLVHHHVDGVLEFQDLALGVDRDLLGQVSAGDRARDHGDLADLVGQVVGHGVDVVGQVLPDPGHVAYVRLPGEFALGAHFAGHPGHFTGEGVQLVDHLVDGVLQVEHLALGVHGDLLAQVTLGDGGRDLRGVTHLVGEAVGHGVDVVGQVLPDARHTLDVGPASELALRADLAGHPGDLVGEGVQLVDHGVDGVLQGQHLTLHVHLDLLGEIALGDGG